MLQSSALEILKTGSNVFLTGVPGAGKSHVIREYIKYLAGHGVFPSVTATTGIASTNIGGMTIHSWSGIGLNKNIDDYTLDSILSREKVFKRIQNSKVLIIDEISMMDANTLDNVDKVCRAIKNGEKAFGGLQVVFVGDFFQLPPVLKKGEFGNFAFASNAWKNAKPLTCYLEEQWRQDDPVFTNLLLAIRAGEVEEMHTEILDEVVKKTREKFGLPEVKREDGLWQEESIDLDSVHVEEEEQEKEIVQFEFLELHSHNKNVDSINERNLNNLEGPLFKYQMIKTGNKILVENLIKSCLSPEILYLKVGAKVIFTKNDIEGKFVNGTLGEVTYLTNFMIEVLKQDGESISVKHSDFAYEEDGKVLAKISQYPLRLAWAITVHKSQGMSLDSALLSLGSSFEYGQGYVALSRLKSLEGLYLKDYNARALQVNSAITEFDEKIFKESKFIEGKFEKADVDNLRKLREKFILSCGGFLEVGNYKKEKVRKDTKAITHEKFMAGKKLLEVVTERNLSRGTIISHLEDLKEEGKIDLKFLKKVLPKEFTKVPKAVSASFLKFKDDAEKKGKLAPVYSDLKKKYTFEDLRIYKLLLDLQGLTTK